ncbi:MAG: beta-glucosidase BglX [Clostridia bacterium]|nr:beta-glucosidase BglX [Clostridia bacterium]
MKESELRTLLSDLSLEEKIGQLIQLPGYFQNAGNITGPAGDMGFTQEDLRLAGSYLSIIGAEKLKKMQTEFMAQHPHHIPLLFMADIINGYRTVFPIPLAQACTFDPELVEDSAAVAAREAAASGIHVTFSPMADLVRDARWGRVMESAGEDPFLSGHMAAAMVRGYQGSDLREPGRIAACLKHFAGYGAPEGGRDYNTVELSERTLREDYLPAYAAAVNAGCELVMTSFNTLNRIPSAANTWLLREILRREMGFEGMIISDWNALEELLAHGIAADPSEAAFLALRAGVDMDMVSPIYACNLKALVENGKVPMKWIDESVWRILSLKNRLGLFEHPFKDADETAEKTVLLSDENRLRARKCAEQSFVLLRNEDALLPLSGTDAVFIGPYAESPLLNGVWSIFADDSDTVSLGSALRRCPQTREVPIARGCTMCDPEQPPIGFQHPLPLETLDAETALEEAVRLAKNAEKVVLCLGEHRECSGEAASRGDLSLPRCQLRLLDAVAAVNSNLIVVLFTGRPLDLRPLAEKAKSILLCWLPGTEGGEAVLNTLLGANNPSGKLSMSFPYCTGQVPVHYNHLNTGRPWKGGIREGRFGSKYQDIPNAPLYPFGYGLSYTTFTCSPVTLSAAHLTRSSTIRAAVTLTNTGTRTGTETVQLYIRDLSGSVARPVRELKGFTRVSLAPGESQEVAFTITEEMLRFYRLSMEYASECGDFDVFIGCDSRTDNGARFTLTE